MRRDQPHASLTPTREEGARMNMRITVIALITMLGPPAFVYFAIFQDGFQSRYYLVALPALFLWLAGSARMMLRTIFEFRRRIDALAASEPARRAPHAR
jgi:hypothetical protein